jgi:hypothetical protein
MRAAIPFRRENATDKLVRAWRYVVFGIARRKGWIHKAACGGEIHQWTGVAIPTNRGFRGFRAYRGSSTLSCERRQRI